MQRWKHPRTPHLPWSEGSSSDDVYLNVPIFCGKHITITEKLDGECTSVYADGFVHARSLEGNYHPSRDWIRGRAAGFSWQLPVGWRVVGENMYAKHSIHYKNLDDYFYVFAIFDQDNICISWPDTEQVCEELHLWTVPLIEAHPYWGDEDWDLLWSGIQTEDGDEIEGYVIRNSDSFHYDDWSKNVAKFVSRKFAPGREHWRSGSVIRNELA